jgi:hypothetical protein
MIVGLSSFMSARQPRLQTAEIDTKNHRSGFGQNCFGKRKNGVRKNRGNPAKGPSRFFAPLCPACHPCNVERHGICAPMLDDIQPNYSYPGPHVRIEFMNTSESLTGMMVSPGA